jgi:microsomal dipeptidase-like Zn-dependent dipeptidase
MFKWTAIIIGALAVIYYGLAWFVVPGALERPINRVLEHAPYQVSDMAMKLHERLTIADLHSDTLLWSRNVLDRADRGHVDVPRLVEGNVALQVFSVVTKVPDGQNYAENAADSDQITLAAIAQAWPVATWGSLLERALYQADKLAAAAQRKPDALKVIRSRTDLDALLAARTDNPALVGGLLATEGSHPLEGEIANIDVLYDAGYRMFGLHHFFDNGLGGSLHGISGEGLSDFGRDVVKAAEARKIIIDVAHSSPNAVADVLDMTTRPVVVSHTGVRGACDSVRNLSDSLMQRIAARGGLIGIGYWEGAVCDISPAGVARSIAYAVELVGEDHVALGSDYDGATQVAFDTSELAVLTDELLKAGLPEQTIAKVMGGNLIRFLRANLPAETSAKGA